MILSSTSWGKTMKYRGYIIEPQYLPGADFKLDSQGQVVPRKPKKEDIDFYLVKEAATGRREPNCSTVSEAKQWIDHMRTCEGQP